MPLSVLSLLLVHLALIVPLKGAAPDEVYKGRRWTNAGGEGPYSLVVSADDTELRPAESIGYALVLQEKKMAKTKTNDELLASGKMMDKYDKVTERLMMKENRKRQRLVAVDGSSIRKRRRNPVVASTTGLPQTMSYNLYNHFRPLDSEVPSDAILPFLDFGRKLSTGATPGVNSLDASSPATRSPTTTPDSFNVDDVTDEEMDVAVQRKTVERNTPPRLAKVRKPTVTGFFQKPKGDLEVKPSDPVVKSDGDPDVKSGDDPDPKGTFVNSRIELEPNKTENHDLQPNESRHKPQVILSPDYGLRLNKTDIQNNPNSTSAEPERQNSENRSVNDTTTPAPEDEGPKSETLEPAETNVTPKIVYALPIKSVSNFSQKTEAKFESESKNASTSEIVEREKQVVKTNRPLPEPSPTARILSTAVVTSVSVKESPRVPRIRNSSEVLRNSSEVHRSPSELVRHPLEAYQTPSELIANSSEVHRNPTEYRNPSELRRVPYDFHRNPSELHHRVNPHNVSDVLTQPENRTVILQSFAERARRKFTTFRPKTTSFRTVTFRSTFRRNASAPAVVHVVSTPPSYIEVPRISPVRSRTTPPSLHHSPSEIVRRIHPQLNAALIENRTTTTSTTTSTTTTTTSAPQPETAETTETAKKLLTTTTTSKTPSTTETVTHPPTDPPVTLIEFRSLDHSDDYRMNLSKFTTPTVVNATVNVTTPRPFNLTNIPDLLWVYGQAKNQTPPPAVASTEPSWGVATYVLVALGIVPIVLGALILVRQILMRSKKKVLDESEYSSEYNRSPLPTKLPRLPAHINWEESKPPPTVAPPVVPSSVGTKWEFSRDKLRLQTVLGQGNFGQVWKAEADDISGHEGLTRLVAVKSVKEGASPKEKEDLLRELGIMQELGAHPNVVTLLGCCTEKEPYFLIMEYVMYGKLLAFLREHRTRAHYFNFSDLSSALNSRDLTVFSYCVARGMEYLVSKGIIHRDLAARNILVDHNKLCKIADFGMSRNVRDTGEIYEQRPNRGALPIRWMAPESLHYNLFTHKSDVWSFGVLLWEIVTLGSTPYNKMGAREVMRQVLDGYRLERPKHCKAEFFKVLAKCWHSDPNKRPTFTELKSEIGTLLGTSESEGRFVDLEAMAEEMMDQDHH